MTPIDESKTPALAKGCRLSASNEGPLLLMPESLILLSASGARILELCDGARTVAEIVSLLKAEHATGARDAIRRDVSAFLAALAARQAVELR